MCARLLPRSQTLFLPMAFTGYEHAYQWCDHWSHSVSNIVAQICLLYFSSVRQLIDIDSAAKVLRRA